MRACLARHLSVLDRAPRLAVGLSGGRDSVALLCVASELRKDLGFELEACHVHHGLSSQAEAWLSFCQRLCLRLQLPLRAARVTVPASSGVGLEAAARKQRYAVYARMPVDALLLAQHRGDQAETLLFNLLRGAAVHGARGMPEKRELRPGLMILRPWLQLPRSAIASYLQARGQDWIEDESNQDLRFSRNFLRRQIMPALATRFPAAEEKLAHSAAHFAEAAQLLDELAQLDLQGASPGFPLPVHCLARLSPERARNLLRFLLAAQGVGVPSAERLHEALRQLTTAAADRHPVIAFGHWRLLRRKGLVHLETGL